MLETCRICLFVINELQCVNIFVKINNKSVLEMIKECSSIQVLEDDALPKYICTKCAEDLNYVHEFRNLIIKSDVKLKENVEANKELYKDQNKPAEESEHCHTNESCDGNVGKFEIKDELNDLVIVQSVKEEEVSDIDLEVAESAETLILANEPEKNNMKTLYKPLRVTKDGKPIRRKKKRQVFHCQECNETFKSGYSFKSHNILHTGVQPHCCDICNKGFPTKWALTIHTRVHTGDKPFECDVCEKKFGSPSGLILHKRTHNSVRKYQCTFCEKSFCQSIQLEVHMRRHTGEKPFMCDICSKTFGDRSILNKHKDRHGQGKQLPCPLCGKIFKDQTCLQAHVKRHSGLKPFSCEECGQKFTLQTSLNRHMLLHYGIKPHKCTLCEKSFSQGSILYRHMRVHSGERPFSCSLCEKEFAYKHHLQGHMKNQHKDDELTESSIDQEDSSNSKEILPEEPV